MKKLLLVILSLVVVITPSFSQGVKEAEKVELIISAAASLTNCMDEIKTLYQEHNPNISITANYGTSGTLQTQIEQGAPADIFFSAGVKQMTALDDKGLVETSTIKQILENKVVLITPVAGKKLSSFEDLKDDTIEKIAVGEPLSVPVGQYTEEAFKNLDLTEALQSKLVYAKDVREVLSWVETGNADAGLVYETDAKISSGVVINVSAPSGSHKKVIYPVACLKDSGHLEEAKKFEEYLFSDEATALFAKYGFTVIK